MTENVALLDAYLNHYAQGKSFRQIAAEMEVEASTVLRRARRCDQKTDHSDWEFLVQNLADYRANTSDHPLRVTPSEILLALGLTPTEAHAQIQMVSGILAVTGSYLLTGDFPKALACAPGVNQLTISRETVCFMFALGYIEPRPRTPVDGQTRIFDPVVDLTQVKVEGVSTERADSQFQVAMRSKQKHRSVPTPARSSSFSLEHLHRRDSEVYSRDVVNVGWRFHEMYVTRETVGVQSIYERIQQRIPDRTFRFLELVCGQMVGLAAVEKELGMPARSAKAVLLHALDLFQNTLSWVQHEDEQPLAG